MGRVLTFRQENEWYAFLKADPQGQERADWMHAILIATMSALHGVKGVCASDYLPKFEDQDPEEVEARLNQKLGSFFSQYVATHDYIPTPET